MGPRLGKLSSTCARTHVHRHVVVAARLSSTVKVVSGQTTGNPGVIKTVVLHLLPHFFLKVSLIVCSICHTGGMLLEVLARGNRFSADETRVCDARAMENSFLPTGPRAARMLTAQRRHRYEYARTHVCSTGLLVPTSTNEPSSASASMSSTNDLYSTLKRSKYTNELYSTLKKSKYLLYRLPQYEIARTHLNKGAVLGGGLHEPHQLRVAAGAAHKGHALVNVRDAARAAAEGSSSGDTGMAIHSQLKCLQQGVTWGLKLASRTSDRVRRAQKATPSLMHVMRLAQLWGRGARSSDAAAAQIANYEDYFSIEQGVLKVLRRFEHMS
jgi:hypothetical protein